jgi:chemotaxis signal transduction protein
MTRAEELREAFDRAFAEPLRPRVDTENLLVIRVGAVGYAVRLDDITGLVTDRVVTPLPAAPRELIGISGFRGAAVPVYDLRILLEHASTSIPRCSLIARHRLVAFAFDALDGHLRVERADVATSSEEPRARHVYAVVRTRGMTLPILDVASLVEGIAARVGRVVEQEDGGR